MSFRQRIEDALGLAGQRLGNAVQGRLSPETASRTMHRVLAVLRSLQDRTLKEDLRELVDNYTVHRIVAVLGEISADRRDEITQEWHDKVEAGIGYTTGQDEAESLKAVKEPRAVAWQATEDILRKALAEIASLDKSQAAPRAKGPQ